MALAVTVSAQTLNVTSTAPSRFAVGVSPASVVTIAFSTTVAPATVNASSFRVFGRWSGSVAGALTIAPAGNAVTFAPARPYFSGEMVTVSLSSAVQSTGGGSLVGGFSYSFHAGAAQGSGTFQQVQVVDFRSPGEGLIRTYGFYAGDIDRDGSPDMSAANEVSYDVRVKRNDGCGNFGAHTLIPMPTGEEPSPNEGADFNGDGWIDLVTGNQNGQSISIFLNNGAGNYLPPVQYPVNGQVHGIAVLDAEGDGDMDVVAPNFSNLALLRNNGNGTFAPATYFSSGGIAPWCVAAADANNDGRTDLFSGNFVSNTVTVLLNNGAGSFTLSGTRPTGSSPWSMRATDLNGNGNCDVLVANNGSSTIGVLLGNGTGGLAAMTGYSVGSNPVWAEVGDVDGDGDLDISSASFSAANATIWRNINGTGAFTSSFSIPTQLSGSSLVIVDYDRDGDTDLIATDELSDRAFIYRQTGPAPSGVQPPSCDAALRINSHAARGGFGASAPTTIPGGTTVFVNVSGAASVPYLLAAGVAQAPGTPTAVGLLNLALVPFPIFLIDGLSGNPAGFTNAHGESLLAFPIPPGTYGGTTLTLQALVGLSAPAGATALSNPETVIFP